MKQEVLFLFNNDLLSFYAVTTKRGEPHQLVKTCLSLQKETVSTDELNLKLKRSGKKEQISSCKLCPLDDKENITACNKFFKCFDAKEVIPRLQTEGLFILYLLSFVHAVHT